MNFRQLRIFQVVCRTESMTGAGRELYMSQPAVSQTIMELEDELQVRLFDRLGRHLYITDAGRTLLTYAVKIIRLVEEAEESMDALREKGGSRLKVGASMTVGTYLLPDLINRFREKKNDIKVETVVANTDRIVSLIMNNDIDLGLVEGLVNQPEIISCPFAQDRLLLTAQPGHLLSGKGAVSLNKLNQLNFIMREVGSGTREITEQFLLDNGISYQVADELNNFEAIKKLVAVGKGLSFLPQMAVQEEIESDRLVNIVLEKQLIREFSYIYHKDKFLGSLIEEFIELLSGEKN